MGGKGAAGHLPGDGLVLLPGSGGQRIQLLLVLGLGLHQRLAVPPRPLLRRPGWGGGGGVE